MKKYTKTLFIFALSIFALSSCSKNEAVAPDKTHESIIASREVVFNAALSSTRVSTVDNPYDVEDAVTLAWEQNDALGVWYAKEGVPIHEGQGEAQKAVVELGNFTTATNLGTFTGEIPASNAVADKFRFAFPAGRIVNIEAEGATTARLIRPITNNYSYDASTNKYLAYIISDQLDIATFDEATPIKMQHIISYTRIPMKFDLSAIALAEGVNLDLTKVVISSEQNSLIRSADLAYDFIADDDLAIDKLNNLVKGSITINVTNMRVDGTNEFYVRFPMHPVTIPSGDVLTFVFTLVDSNGVTYTVNKTKNALSDMQFKRGARNEFRFNAGEAIINPEPTIDNIVDLNNLRTDLPTSDEWIVESIASPNKAAYASLIPLLNQAQDAGKTITLTFEDVTTIIASAFDQSQPEYAAAQFPASMHTLIFPALVSRPGGNAFKNCANLVKISLPKVESLATASIFTGCTNLAEIEIASDVSAFAIAHQNPFGLGNNSTAKLISDFTKWTSDYTQNEDGSIAVNASEGKSYTFKSYEQKPAI